MKRYILIENIKEPILVSLEEGRNKDGYVVFPKNNLDKLPSKVRNILIKNGLYKNIDSALNSNNCLFSLQRLVTCLYGNIVGFVVHHIKNDISINNICNLIKVTDSVHTCLHSLEKEESKLEAYKRQKKSIKTSRNTLAKNAELILEILKLRGI